MEPGATVFTRIFCGASATASDFAWLTSAALAAP